MFFSKLSDVEKNVMCFILGRCLKLLFRCEQPLRPPSVLDIDLLEFSSSNITFLMDNYY